MKIYIKNMVCSRCKMVVKATLENLGLHPLQVELGEVELGEADISAVKEGLVRELQSLGFDLLDDKKTKTIERIKNKITFIRIELHETIWNLFRKWTGMFDMSWRNRRNMPN